MNRVFLAVLLATTLIFVGVPKAHTQTALCWDRWGQQIEILAQRHQVPRSLILALVVRESNCRVDAVRFEPHVYTWSGVIKAAKGDVEERRFLASSWGLAQVLGIIARGMGYDGGRKEFKVRSLEYGVRYLAIKKQKWGSWNNALRAYHGGDGAVRKHRQGRANPKIESYVRSVNALRKVAKKELT